VDGRKVSTNGEQLEADQEGFPACVSVFCQTALTVIFSVLQKFTIYRKCMKQTFNYMQLACCFCHEMQLLTCRTCQQFLHLLYNAGRSRSMRVDNSSIERVEEFKYLGATLTNQKSIQEEIKSRLKLRNACYYSVQNLLSSSLLSKNLKIKIYRTLILPVVLYVLNLGR
jgi:hypothetical protein